MLHTCGMKRRQNQLGFSALRHWQLQRVQQAYGGHQGIKGKLEGQGQRGHCWGTQGNFGGLEEGDKARH